MIAICQIRQQPEYRRYAFEEGLRRAGYRLVQSGHPGAPEDLFVIWNRYGAYAAMADAWERAGGTVLVCENGYIGRDEQDRKYYAISVHGHNGSGWFPVGDEDRFSKLGIEVQPWRAQGEHLVVRGQRGIGLPPVASPPSWHDEIGRNLRSAQSRPVKIIPHPGNVDPKPTHEEELRNAHACVIWSSATGVQALVMGIPVFYASPSWIGTDSAVRINSDRPDVESPMMDDEARRQALHKMAWGQRSVAEIESGEPFATIRENILQKQQAA